MVRQKDSLLDPSSVLAGLHNLLRNNDCFGPDTLSREEIDNFAWNTFSSASWLKDSHLLTLLDIESRFLENTPGLHLSRFKTILNHKPLSTIERKHVLKDWTLLCTNTPDDPDLFLGHAQRVFVDKPALLSELEDAVWNCTVAVKTKSLYLDIIIPTAITQLDKSPQDWLKVFGLTTDRSLSGLTNIAEALLRNRPRFEGHLPPPKAIIQLLQLHVIPNLSLNTVPLAMKFCSDAVAEYAQKKEDLATVFSQRLSQLEHLCREASAHFLIRCSETPPFSDHSEGFIRVAFHLEWTTLSTPSVFTLCKKIVDGASTFSTCELISKLGISHIENLTVTQAKYIAPALFRDPHFSDDHRIATKQIITCHPHSMKLLSPEQLSIYLGAQFHALDAPSFEQELRLLFQNFPRSYWPIIKDLGDKFPPSIVSFSQLNNDAFLSTAFLELSKTLCTPPPFPSAWIPFLNHAVEKDTRRANQFNAYFEDLYSKSVSKPTPPFEATAPDLQKAWVDFKANRKLRLAQEKAARFEAIKTEFAKLFKTFKSLDKEGSLLVSQSCGDEIKRKFLSISEPTVQEALLDIQFSISKGQTASIYYLPFFTLDRIFLETLTSLFPKTSPNLALSKTLNSYFTL